MAAAEIEIKLSNGAKAGDTLKELTKQANTLNKEIKNLKPGTQEFIDKAKDLEAVNGKMGDIKKQIKEVTTASDFLKQAWNKLPGAQYFNQIGESFGIMKKGVGGLISSFGVLKTAIASTGIGLLVILISSLVTWFTKTEEGADKLKSVLYPLQVLFQKLTGILADLGGKVFKKLAEAIDDPIKAIKDLGQALLDNFINRFKAVMLIWPAIQKIFTGDWKEGVKDLGNAFIQMGTGFEKVIDKAIEAGNAIGDVWSQAAADGQKLLDLENAIEDAEAALVVSRAKLNVLAAQQMEIARDASKSDAERLQAAQNFAKVIDEQTAQEENFLRLKKQRLILEQDLDGILTDDERLVRAQAEADIIQLQADNIDKKKKARALELQLMEEIAKREVEIAHNIADLKVEAMAEGINKEIEQIELSTDRKIEALQGSEEQITEQKILLLEIQEQQIQAVRDKYAEEQAAKDKVAKEAQKKRDDDAAAKKISAEQAVSDAEQKIEAIRVSTVQQTTSAIGDLVSNQIKNQKAAKAARKTFAIADVAFSLIQELTANAAAGAKISAQFPPYTVPAGIAYTSASNLSSIIRAGIATAKIALFKKGGIPDGVLDGPSHADGGIPLIAEGKEIILTKGVFENPRLRAAASAINVAGGGRKFATGGPVTPFKDRAAVSSSQASQGINDANKILENKLDSLITSVDKFSQWPSQLKVVNVATETQAVNDKVKMIQNQADV